MTPEPHPCGQPPAQPRPGWRALLALCLSVAALLLPRGLAAEAPAAPATEKPAAEAAPGPLCFTAETDDVTVALETVGPAPQVALEISPDGQTWQEWKTPRKATLAHKGDRVYVRATSTNGAFAGGDDAWNYFVITGKAAASGSVMSLLDRDDKRRSLEDLEYAFAFLFFECQGLTAAPELPATTLSVNCYAEMFYGCTRLKTAPALPATILDEQCYLGMFAGCVSLTVAPRLPATALRFNCYREMFKNCKGLTAAPELPATKLAESCYAEMFYGCTGLKTAPALPATKLKKDCYAQMFQGCTKLAAAPQLPANATGLQKNGHDKTFASVDLDQMKDDEKEKEKEDENEDKDNGEDDKW